MKDYKIKFGELHLNQKSIDLANECFSTNWNSIGPKTAELERQFAKLFGYKFATAVNSGSSAIIVSFLSLLTKNARFGDEIICPALSFIASGTSIQLAGFKPVFVDIKEDLTIDESLIPQAITPNTVAILAVNLMGTPAKLNAIRQICDIHGLTLICDNCEGYGSKLHERYALADADIEVSSHYVAHILTGGMEGGIITSRNKDDDDTFKAIRSHGRLNGSKFFNHAIFGGNFKTTDVASALLLGEIDSFWSKFEQRKDNLYHLSGAMYPYQHIAYFTTEAHGSVYAPHAFSITIKEPYKKHFKRLQQTLEDASIEAKINFRAMYKHGCFRHLAIKDGSCPIAEYMGDHGLHIPVHEWLSSDDVLYMIDVLEKFFKSI